MERYRVAIVIPALNEKATIVGVVIRAAQFGLAIVVDDGSIDDTGELSISAGASVVKHKVNMGYDHALNSGFARALELGCEYVITMDADGQHDPTFLSAFIKELREGADAVFGIRDRKQRVAEHIFAWVSNLKWGIHDPLCGMKAYRLSLYEKLGHFDSYSSIGTELAIFSAKNGKRIEQIPIKTRDRTDEARFGRKFSSNMKILHSLLCALFR